MPGKLSVAVIGCGNIGKVHVERYAQCPRTELAWLVDADAEKARKLAGEFHVPNAAKDYGDMLKDPEVHAVSVCLPNDLHCPVTLECLRAGKHVLCEKPIALNTEEAERMRSAARKADRVLAIGVVNRFNTYVNLVRQSIAAGDLGELYHVNFVFKAYRSIPGLGGWFTTKRRAGGGVMIDWGIHFLDLALYCAGFPTPRKVSGAAYSRLGRSLKEYAYLSMWAGPPDYNGVCDVEEYASGLIRTSGPSLSFEGAWAQNVDAPAMFIDFFGDRGGIRLNYGQEFTLYSFKEGTLFEKKPQKAPDDMFLSEVASFADCCLNKTESPARIDSVIVSQRIIDGFYASAASGREVEL